MLSFLFHSKTGLSDSAHTRGKVAPVAPEKRYRRFPQIPLAEGHLPEMTLADALRLRRSADDFAGTSPPSAETLGTLLQLGARSVRIGERSMRPYPSGGGCYPFELYFVRSGAASDAGIFHYAPAEHALERLFPSDDGAHAFERIKDSLPDHWKEGVPAYFLLSAVWRRTFRTYGDFGYRLILTEAGHLSQNLLLAGTALGLRGRMTSGIDEIALAEILDFSPGEETVLYAIALGEETGKS